MDSLAKWLFPHNPRMVRHRKLQMLVCTVVVSAMACAMIGGVLVLLCSLGNSRY